MRFLSPSLLLLSAAFVLGSCQKEVGHIGSPDPQPVLPTPITATLQGNVLDETGAPASGVTVKVGSRSVSTDSKGFFRITGAALDQNQALVTAEKSGYFKAYRSFAATSGANQVSIKLIKRALAGSVSATAGGEASLANGSKVALPANGIVVASTGAAYTGSVNVYAAYIDPTAADIGQTIPGSLMANDASGKRVMLNSYGMLAVELEGASGEKLQIKSGQNATLTTAIPAAAQASAPATIAMWYVDETTGIWKEQGSATRQGNVYVGTVPHFSFWNVDVAVNTVTLTVTLKNTDGAPLANAAVRISRPGQYFTSATGWTDSLGKVSGFVFANQPLELAVLDACYNPVYTQAVGPFSQNTTLPTITVDLGGSGALTTVTGKLVNCSNSPVTNGFAIVSISNSVRYVATDAAGNFSTNILNCAGASGIVQVIGVDNATQQQSNASSTPFAAPATNAGTLTVCGVSAQQYINYTVDGTSYSLGSSNNDSLHFYSTAFPTSNSTSLGGFNMTNNREFGITFNHAPTAGTYNIDNLSVNGTQPNLTTPIPIVITNWPSALGGYLEATFSGSYTSGGATHTISGQIRLRRQF